MKWMKLWGKTKARHGEQDAMPDGLENLTLWYTGRRQLISFHPCAPEKCNRYLPILCSVSCNILTRFSCEASTKHIEAGQQSNRLCVSTPPHSSYWGSSGGVCVNPIAVHHHQHMTPSYPGHPTTAPFPTAPNAFDNCSSMSGNIATMYNPQSKQAYPSIVNIQDSYLTQSRSRSSPQNSDLFIHRPAAFTEQPPCMKTTGAMIEASAQPPAAASPTSNQARKRSRRSSPEPSVDDEIPHDGCNSFVNCDADPDLFY
ncbi:MAG: hypothetical protein Q9182_005228 [Xanthomendoza sp. 2 TL-2023]